MLTELLALLTLKSLLLSSTGVFLGIVVGALPGLNGGTLMALTLPLTYFMQPVDAQILLIGMYVGDVSGGMIAATLIGVAGSPASIMTTLDAYALSRRGLAATALGLGIAASFAGSMLAWGALAFISEPLARFGLRFGPFEMFALVVTGLVMIAAVGGRSFLHAIIAGLLGVLCSIPGLDPVDAQPRLTFGIPALQGGLGVVPVILGIFAVAPIVAELVQRGSKGDRPTYSASFKAIVSALTGISRHLTNVLRSSVIGTVVGVLPGIGAAIGSTVSYMVARLSSKQPDRFGKGAEEGVVASEAGNNATVCGALVPMISLGIPGSSADVILIAALIIHGIQPGPLLITERPDAFYGVIGAALLATVLMLPLMLLSSAYLSNMLRIPKHLLTTVVIALCMLGTYVSGNSLDDLWILLAFSLLGFVLIANDLPLPAFIIGFILGPMAESSLRTALMTSQGSFLPLVQRPIPLFMLLAAAAVLAWVVIRSRGARVPRSTPKPGESIE